MARPSKRTWFAPVQLDLTLPAIPGSSANPASLASKTCSICKITKDLSCFYPKKGERLGVRCECKDCNKIQKKKYALQMARYTARKKDEGTALVNELKAAPCMDCKQTFPPECMDFDHREPGTKRTEISRIRHYGKEAILSEIAKCDLVCANCHRVRTHARMKRASENKRNGR